MGGRILPQRICVSQIVLNDSQTEVFERGLPIIRWVDGSKATEAIAENRTSKLIAFAGFQEQGPIQNANNLVRIRQKEVARASHLGITTTSEHHRYFDMIKAKL